MSARDPIALTAEPATGTALRERETHEGAALMRALVGAPAAPAAPALPEPVGAASTGVVIGELLALTDDGRSALVRFAAGADGADGAEGAAVRARSTVDLHGAHIGKPVVLMFENADPLRPIVMGVLRGEAAWPLGDKPGQVEVQADGERLVVSAKEQLVLRCGKASITLTKAGKVLIEGAYVSSRSSGVNRLKGGSVQLN
jgi:Domain of unknown function (DUF6484)